MRLGLAQIDVVVGDLSGNAERIVAAVTGAAAEGCDLVATPELSLTGYPPEDLILKPRFVTDNLATLERLATDLVDLPPTLVGFVDRTDAGLANAVALLRAGSVEGVVHKTLLPNTAVFDEQRYFAAATTPQPLISIGGHRIGLSICEDAWSPNGPIVDLARAGAEVVINVNASPYCVDRQADRRAMLAQRTREAGVAIAYVNLVGGQDELVFDGGSTVVAADGTTIAEADAFAEMLLVVDLDDSDPTASPVHVPTPASHPGRRPDTGVGELWDAVVTGTRDYVIKNGFTDVVLGLSGGIDSAIVAVIAADALGAEHVHTVALPSRYSSAGSLADAADLAARLGCDHRVVGICEAHDAAEAILAPHFAGTDAGLAEENVQARLRGLLLMALSNKFGWMLLSTGNKSELAVGYSTLYGDMNGGFNPIKDLLKTTVYELSRWRNEQAATAGHVAPIPEAIIDKAPSAELRPDQRDDQSLPPYDVLDPLLAAYVEDDRTRAELIESGHASELVDRIVTLVDRAEYKRRQAPPGVRVTRKAFGKDRRLPITNAYRA